MEVRTRFAPSPTGYLHIGGARTALFNYLFAKHHAGKFLLRIEDTDEARSTDSAKQAIIKSLAWLDLDYDEDIVYQSARRSRHVEVAQQLLAEGKAYYCFTPQQEIIQMKADARQRGEHFIFHSPWRDTPPSDHPKDVKPVIRLTTPQNNNTIVDDLLQGKVTIQNSHIDDMILVRADGTPTYMLAVVVDDHDMGITHIIRGDDHLTNAHRQHLIYLALNWDSPKMIHIPLIHGSDGAKLSKRHGALGVEEYKDMGYLPEALNNYLLRLGWSHGNDEIISRQDAIKWFGVDGMGKSPSCLNFDKMRNVNAYYLRTMNADELLKIIERNLGFSISPTSKGYLVQVMDSIKTRSELITDLCDLAKIYIVEIPLEYSEDAKKIITECETKIISEVVHVLKSISDFNKQSIQESLKDFAEQNNIKIRVLMKYIRILMTGRTVSPSIFEMIEVLGIDNTINRLMIKDDK